MKINWLLKIIEQLECNDGKGSTGEDFIRRTLGGLNSPSAPLCQHNRVARPARKGQGRPRAAWFSLKSLIEIIGISLLLSVSTYAAPLYYGSLENNIGARATALSQAFTALGDNPETLHWNPAGLATQPDLQVSLMYATLFDEVQTRWVSVSAPVAGGVMSLGYHSLMVPNNITTDSLGNAIGNFNFTDDALILGYGLTLDQLNLGVSAKILRQQAIDQTMGANMDLGLIYNAKPFNIGLVFADFLNTSFGQDSFSHKIRVGIAYTNENLRITADLHHTLNRSTDAMLGAEYLFCDEFSVLGGLNNKNYSLGARLKLLGFAIDYAFTPHDLGNIHYFQMGLQAE